MNKKGQGFLAMILMYIMAWIIWAVWLGEYLSYWSAKCVTDNAMTGVQAFLVANINLWFFVGLLISGAIMFYVGTNN